MLDLGQVDRRTGAGDGAARWAGVLGYASCRLLLWQLVGVCVPALVGLLGLVLMAAAP